MAAGALLLACVAQGCGLRGGLPASPFQAQQPAPFGYGYGYSNDGGGAWQQQQQPIQPLFQQMGDSGSGFANDGGVAWQQQPASQLQPQQVADAPLAQQQFQQVEGTPSPPPPKPVGGTLWCFSLMMPSGIEQELITWQFNKKVSIFACEGSAVFSSGEWQIVPGLVTKKVNSDLQCSFGGDSGSALNTWIFIAVWKRVIDDGEYQAYKWVVKVDPDCVFFPERLLAIVPMYSTSDYIVNCRYGLHGPMEVVSKSAMDRFAADFAASADGNSPKTCVERLDFSIWGEDMFLDQCFVKILGLRGRPLEPRLICEDHCNCPAYEKCQSGSDRVSYHPFKTPGEYEACMARAKQDQTPSRLPAQLHYWAPGAGPDDKR